MGWKAEVVVVVTVIVDLISVQNSLCDAELSATSPSSDVFECSFDPTEISGLFEGETVSVFANCSARSPHVHGQERHVAVAPSLMTISAVSVDATIADVVDGESLLYTSEWSNQSFNFSVRGHFLGRTSVFVSLCPPNDTSGRPSLRGSGVNQSRNGDPDGSRVLSVESSVEYRVAVIRNVRAVDHIFLVLVTVLVICGSVGIGCKVDLAVVKEVLVRPVAPAIGFGCQYIIMPLTAFGLVKLLGLSGGQALGFFASGCAPGGGSSNMYTYLLGGEVSLSVTLTLISLLASLFMIPFWLFTLGQLISSRNMHLRIPFQNIILSLAAILIPVAIGILIQKKWIKGAKFIVRCLRPFYVLLILCMFTIGVYSNLYIFRLITPTLIIAGCLLPYIGFLLGGLIAFILRQPLPRILTIAIETGIQNTGLPIILMQFSLPQPDADLSVVSPVVVAMFMPLPLWVAVGIVEIRRRCCKKRGQLNIEPVISAVDTAQTTPLEENVGEKLVQSNNNTVNSDPALNSKDESSQKKDETQAAVIVRSKPL